MLPHVLHTSQQDVWPQHLLLQRHRSKNYYCTIPYRIAPIFNSLLYSLFAFCEVFCGLCLFGRATCSFGRAPIMRLHHQSIIIINQSSSSVLRSQQREKTKAREEACCCKLDFGLKFARLLLPRQLRLPERVALWRRIVCIHPTRYVDDLLI